MMIPDGSKALYMLRTLVQDSPHGMLAFDRECRYLLWNATMERITGMQAEEVLGRSAFEVFPLSETAEESLFQEALAGRRASLGNRPFHIHATGRRGHYEGEFSPWRNDAGEIVGGIGIIRDVTDARMAEAQLRETEARFTTMADAAPVLLWMSRTDGMCVFFNQTWLDFTGRTLEDEWGMGWSEYVHYEDFQRCVDTYVQAFAKREVLEMEYRLLRKDGEYRWILDRGTPRYTPDGEFSGYIGSCIDITERKQLEADLRKAVRLRDEFLSVASHELRTPLTSLQLSMQSLVRSLDKDSAGTVTNSRIGKNANIALRQTKHLTEMVQTLLDVSRLAEGKLILEREELDVTELVREVLDRIAGPAESAGCELRLQVEEGSIRARWDRLRTEQIVTNLLSNALKFGAGKPLDVFIGRTDGSARIRIRDQGPGIPPEQQARLFERFARFAPTRSYGGFGLGLWISKQIAEAHGGHITIESEPGHGAIFTVDLPCSMEHDKTKGERG